VTELEPLLHIFIEESNFTYVPFIIHLIDFKLGIVNFMSWNSYSSIWYIVTHKTETGTAKRWETTTSHRRFPVQGHILSASGDALSEFTFAISKMRRLQKDTTPWGHKPSKPPLQKKKEKTLKPCFYWTVFHQQMTMYKRELMFCNNTWHHNDGWVSFAVSRFHEATKPKQKLVYFRKKKKHSTFLGRTERLGVLLQEALHVGRVLFHLSLGL